MPNALSFLFIAHFKDDFKIKWEKTKQSSQSGESVIGARSEIFPIRKHYVTAEAQTRIPSRCLTIDAASDHHQLQSYGKNHGTIETSSVKPVESKPIESTNSIPKVCWERGFARESHLRNTET